MDPRTAVEAAGLIRAAHARGVDAWFDGEPVAPGTLPARVAEALPVEDRSPAAHATPRAAPQSVAADPSLQSTDGAARAVERERCALVCQRHLDHWRAQMEAAEGSPGAVSAWAHYAFAAATLRDEILAGDP